MIKIRAFSLAEILVTLMIIGVIAGMTIPALKKDSMNRTVATNLKKIYSELNQVVALTLTENYTNRVCRTGLFDSVDTFEKEFVKSKLNVVTICDSGSPEKCFGNSTLVSSDKSYLLNSGIAVAFVGVDVACSDGPDFDILIFIDVNGPKPPNKGGSDQFMMQMNGMGKVYMGSGAGGVSGEYTSDTCADATSDYEAAWACAIKIQQDGWEIKY